MKRKPTIRQRARAILEDDDRYDVDTRNAIASALKRNDTADLREFVARAEKGEIILDTVAEQEKFEKAASLFIELFNSSAPDWLTGAMLVAASDAATAKNIPIYKKMKGAGEDFDEKGLADLFLLSQRLDLKPVVSPSARQRVADALSELLLNAETPADLFNKAAAFVCDCMSDEGASKAIFWQPEMLAKLIDHRLAAQNGASEFVNSVDQKADEILGLDGSLN